MIRRLLISVLCLCSSAPQLQADDAPLLIDGKPLLISGGVFRGPTTTEPLPTPGPDNLIDAAWLSANATAFGGPPYVLGVAFSTYAVPTGKYYYLDNNLTVNGTAFVVGATGVTLDLNGSTITYDNADQVTVNNTGFETAGGSATLAANWDQSNSPHITRIARTQYGMYGANTLQATGYTGTEYILSDTITVPAGAQSYEVYIIPMGPFEATVTMAIVDASSPTTVLATGNSSNVSRGTAARCQWDRAAGATTTIKLKISVTLTVSSQVVYLDFAGLSRAIVPGIWAAASFSSAPIQLTSLASITGYLNDGNNFVLTDTAVTPGGVVQGKKSYKGHAIYAQAATFRISGPLTLSVNGMSCALTWGNFFAGGCVIEDVTGISSTDAVLNRFDAVGAYSFGAGVGPVMIRRNTLTGSGHIGIGVGRQVNAAQNNHIVGTLIEENKITDWVSKGTDGYAIVVNGIKDSTIRRNKVTCANGRCLLLDGFGSSSSVNVTIGAADYTDANQMNAWWGDPDAPADPSTAALGEGNYFNCRERANLEYWTRFGMETTCVRLRYFTDPATTCAHVGIKFNGNYVYAETDAAPDASLDLDKWNYAAHACRATMSAEATQQCYEIHGNTFKSILLGIDAGLLGGGREPTAIAFAFSCYSTGGKPTVQNDIADNTYESNDVCVSMGDPDSGGGLFGTQNVYGSTFIKSADGDQTIGFELMRVGDWSGIVDDFGFYGNTYAGGATEAVSWGGPSVPTPLATSIIKFGDRLAVHVTTIAPANISGATVTILNEQGASVFSGTTDAAGLTTATPLARKTITHNGTSPTTVTNTPFDITASKAGYTTNSSLNYALVGDATETIILSP